MLTNFTSVFRRRRVLIASSAAVVVALVAVLLVVFAQAPAAGGGREQAAQTLSDVAGAQKASKDLHGSFASYNPDGGDRSLEAGGREIRRDGTSGLRSIACQDGWVAAVRAHDGVYLRSSAHGDVVKAGETDVARPGCITGFAVEAMLTDLGVDREWPAPEAARFAAPAEDPGYRPAYHLTPEQHWMNDPQRPFFLDGQWHYYYLYNADYPEGNGTEWFHATSTDLVHWKNEGVAIQKFRNGLGDIETGTAVVDTEGTAGFGKGAVIAVLTQQHDGVQRQSLFYSTDNGYTFTNFEQNPVMENPGQEHWRDPRIVRDETNGQWLMLLAEGHKLGFYTSKDLKEWTYASGFERSGLGILECPDFFQLDVDGDPSRRTWVLAAGANGSAEGRTTGLAYWTGEWDGKTFTVSNEQHQWLDAGPDFYAAVTWDDPRLTDGQRKSTRQAIGWMNNWAYARQVPTEGWFGADSIVRDIRLVSDDGRPTLVSRPTPTLRALEGTPAEVSARTLGQDEETALPIPDNGAFKIDVEFEKAAIADRSEARLLLQAGEGTFATVGYDFREGKAFVTRDGDAAAKGRVDDAYRQVRSVASPAEGGKVKLTIYVDRSSVEVFVNGGKQTLTSLVFPPTGSRAVKVAAAGGPISLKAATVTPLAAIK